MEYYCSIELLPAMSDIKQMTASQELANAGGYFFGTVPDGRLVQDVIHKFGKWPRYEQPMLKLKACWEGESTPFGCGYTCAIGDTVTEGNNHSLQRPQCQIVNLNYILSQIRKGSLQICWLFSLEGCCHP